VRLLIPSVGTAAARTCPEDRALARAVTDARSAHEVRSLPGLAADH
jgi:hypothetical protein